MGWALQRHPCQPRGALEAYLDHARRAGIGRFIFLGDYVGYGADPGFAVDTIMREVDAGAAALFGNHADAIASGSIGMNSVALRHSIGHGFSSTARSVNFSLSCR